MWRPQQPNRNIRRNMDICFDIYVVLEACLYACGLGIDVCCVGGGGSGGGGSVSNVQIIMNRNDRF